MTFVFALIVAQGIHLYRGEFAEAIALGDEILALCREYQFPQEAEWARAFQGSAHAVLGEIDGGHRDARAEPRRRCKALGLGPGPHGVPDASSPTPACRAGRVDEGHKALDEAFAHSEQTIERGFLAELHRVRGELFCTAGRRCAGRRAAAHVARSSRGEQDGEVVRAAGRNRAGAAADRRGTDAEARDVLAPVYDWFTEGLDTGDLVAARTLLSEVG